MSALLGIRWVRAVMLDDEVRADFLKYMDARKQYLSEKNRAQRDDIELRWTQGALQALEETLAFIDNAMSLHKQGKADDDNVPPIDK